MRPRYPGSDTGGHRAPVLAVAAAVTVALEISVTRDKGGQSRTLARARLDTFSSSQVLKTQTLWDVFG